MPATQHKLTIEDYVLESPLLPGFRLELKSFFERSKRAPRPV